MKTSYCLPVVAALLAVFGLGGTTSARAADKSVRVLIFSGQNNHDWKATTPKLKSILADSGRFAVEVTDHPEQCTAETFARCDVIVCNWNAWGKVAVTNWPPATRAAFLDFVRRGGGHVVVHAGGSTFYDWAEYQQIAAASWDLAKTSHGAPHEFTVQPDADHPVTRGVAPFQTKDELWLKPGVHPTAKVIATGDGQPLVMTTAFGRGRCLALLLGHSADFMETPGFQTLLLRATEWAATGKVTIRGAGDTSGLDPDAVIKSVAAYHFGDNRKAVFALEQIVFAASTDAAAKPALSGKLAAALGADATPEGKRCFCQGLSLIGSAAEVPVLAQALLDTNLFFHARQALERIPAAEAAAALRAALGTTAGTARASVINSLAARREAGAVPELAKFVADADREVAGAAIEALGKIGGAPTASALQSAEARVPAELRERFAVVLLGCAESLQASGKTAEAAALYAKLVAPGQPAHVRMAAFPSYVAAQGGRGSEEVLAALTGGDKSLQGAALRALRSHRDQPALLRAAVEKLEKLPAELQESVLVLCGERGDAAVLPAVTKAAAGADPAVKRAAIKALGLIGDGSVVQPLVSLIEAAADDEKKALSEALARLRGAGVDAALVLALQNSPAAAQRTIISALAAREARSAAPALLQIARAGDATVRRDAITALGKLADAGAALSMIQLLDQAGEADRAALETALVEVCRRDNCIPSIAAALSTVAPGSRVILLGVLGSTGGSPACTAVRGQLKSDHPAVRLAAVRVLADWPDAEPLDDLATLVETTGDAKVRSLAARGLNRMAPQAPARALRAAQALARALAATTDPADQKSFLAALIGIPSVPSLQAAQALLKHPTLAADAAAGLVKIAEVIYPWHNAEVRAALAEFKPPQPSASVLAARADKLTAKLDQLANLAVGGLATSPDGLEKDGQASGDQAAIDGDPKTYWDEEDNQKLYILRVQLRERSTVGCLRIMGFQQHSYAPKDFAVLCDDKVVKTVTGALYANNWLSVEFPPTPCDAVELKITGYYGQSPAIRELEIYEKAPAK